MEKKKFKTVSDFKYGFGSRGFYKDHSRYMAVITPFGVFIPTRLGFGGNNGPAKIQRIADHLFADLPSVYVYIDDILIATETFYEHLEAFQEVFRRIREGCLRVSVKTPEFCKDAVNNVGSNKGFDLRIVTRIISFSFRFLNMLRP
jgi:hypothetical protein